MERGDISTDEMYHIFNMGIGFVVAVAPEDAQTALDLLRSTSPGTCIIGEITEGEGITIR